MLDVKQIPQESVDKTLHMKIPYFFFFALALLLDISTFYWNLSFIFLAWMSLLLLEY